MTSLIMNAKSGSGQMALKPFCLDLVKGWTRATAVTFIALVASELDLDDPATMPLLEPLGKVLDPSLAGSYACISALKELLP